MLFYIKGELREQESLPVEKWLGMVASTWQLIKQLENNGKVLAGGAMSADGAALQRLPPTVAIFIVWIEPTRAAPSAIAR